MAGADLNLSSGPAPAEAKPRRKGRAFWLKLVVSLSLFAWIVSRTELQPVLAAMSGVDPRWLLAAFLSQFVGAAIIALRWQGLLAVRAVEPGYAFLLKSTLASLFFRQFMPSVIGGDALRGHDAWRAGASPGFALVSLLVDRLLGLLALALFALLALLIFGSIAVELSGVLLPISLGIAGLVAVLALLFVQAAPGARRLEALRARLPRQVATKVGDLVAGFRVYRGHGRVLGRVFLLSVLLQVNVVTFYWMLSQALGLDVPYTAFYAIVPLAIFVMMVPITINGIGLRETMFVFLLGLWSVEEGPALAFAWLEFGLVLAVGAFGGLVYLFRTDRFAARAPQP